MRYPAIKAVRAAIPPIVPRQSPDNLTSIRESLHAAAGEEAKPGVIDDAVHEIVEEVLSKSGHVVFLDDNRLADHNRIAMVLRY